MAALAMVLHGVPAEVEPPTEPPVDLDAVIAALSGTDIRLDAPDLDGLAALVRGDSGRAQARLPEDDPSLSVYRAMAMAGRPEGMSRARRALMEGAKRKDPKAAFLVALLQARAGQTQTAHSFLKMALQGAEPLSERFAPDPAVELVVRAWRAWDVDRSEAERVEAQDRLLDALWRAGRSRVPPPLDGSARWRLRRAFAFDQPEAERWARLRLRDDPADPVALAGLAEKALDRKDLERARQHLNALDEDAPELRARLALADGRAKDAEAILQAVPPGGQTSRILALWARALLELDRVEPAEALVRRLVKRQPTDVDPYRLLAEIDRRRQRSDALSKLRSQGVQEARSRLRAGRAARIDVLSTVERSRDALGLDARREREVKFGLPLDLALAARGSPAEARAARDRILAACRDDVANLLRRRSGWDEAPIQIQPYGKAVVVMTRLPAADPGRCGGLVQGLAVPAVRP